MNSVTTLYAPVSSGSKWYVACTCARHEKRVAERLSLQGVENLLPVFDTLHHWKNGQKRLQLPLFPGYIFVHIHLRERARVLAIPSVAYLLGGPTPIAEEEMSAVRELSRRGVTAEPHPYISIGQRVRVRSGILKDLEGTLVRKKDRFRMVISVDSIMRSVMLDMDVAEIDFAPIQLAA